MPRLSRWLVRTAFVHLLLALTLGVVALSPRAQAAWPALGRAAPAELHLFVVGWITQLIAGVAYWLFPRVVRGAPAEDPRGWWVYAGLNLGLALRVAGEPWAGAAWAGPVLAGSALAQLGAGIVLVVSLWPRTRAR
ncbi:MAG TPA: hypothetical protein VFS28_01550 [Gemmatimonadales bacterium]|jgi:cbb3-type cytochrome oxidase subunit 1|nr:hypothetical protein [Gemmatimonadales bacterium]